MDALVARILKFLNGALFYDDSYKFCTYIVTHYLEMESLTMEKVCREAGVQEANVLNFIQRLGYQDWDRFYQKMLENHATRLDQIRSRMLGLDAMTLVKEMQKDMTDEEMDAYISEICEQIDKHKRIYLVGGLYPMSIAVEFQTDLITFGKCVLQFHNYDPDMVFCEDDLIIFISATGRAMKGFMASKGDQHPEKATSLLITQNPVYTREQYRISTYTLKVPGRYDGLDFNYQLMHIFDLLRIHYYQQYYLGKR